MNVSRRIIAGNSQDQTSCGSRLSPPPEILTGLSAFPPAIFSLPTELFLQITAAGQEGRVPGISSNKVFKSEWTMSHVCTRFRDIVIGAPSLWSLVEADFYVDGSVQILKLYLERSQNCEIWAMCEYSGYHVDEHLISQRLSHILPHTPRMYRLGIVAGVFSLIPMLDAFRDVAAPALTHLELRFTEGNLYYHWPLDFFSSGPPLALTFLSITGFARYPFPPWTASVTHLEMWRTVEAVDEDDNDLSIPFTVQCPALVHLHIETDAWDSLANMRICIPSLKSLGLSVQYPRDGVDLLTVLASFDTPALTSLKIVHAHRTICSFLDPTSVLNSAFPALTSLSFVNDEVCDCVTILAGSSCQLRLPAALLSLTLINQCSTAHIIKQILGPASESCRLAELTVCPMECALQDVYETLQGVIRSKRERAQRHPKLRFSPMLYNKSYWTENGVNVSFHSQ